MRSLPGGVRFGSSSAGRPTDSPRHVSKPDVSHSVSSRVVTDPMDEWDSEDEEDLVPMINPETGEWGGPTTTRAGSWPEPTRYGDWEQKGRCTDF